VVTLVELKYTLVSEDPYGAYNEARINLHGQLTSVNIHAVGDLPVSKYEIRQSNDGEPTDLIPDTNPIDIPLDTLPRGKFYALKYSTCKVEYWNCLILARSPGERNTFCRVGIAEVESSWFGNCPKLGSDLTWLVT